MKQTQDNQQNNKMKSMNRMARGMIHELNNLLTIITLNGRLLLMNNQDNPDLQEDIQDILKAGERTSFIIDELSNFTGKKEAHLKKVDLNILISTVKPDLKKLIEPNHTLSFKANSNPFMVMVDPHLFREAVTHLVKNAKESMPDGGEIVFETKKDGEIVSFVIRDQGSGIKEENLPVVFDPFFTTKKEQGHKGLGLSQTYGIIQQMKGWIDVKNGEEKGSEFTIGFRAEN